MRGRDAAAQLLRALARGGGDGMTMSHEGETSWASATFVGARHRVAVRGDVTGPWLDGLDEADLPMRGCFAASIAVERTAEGAMLTVLVLEE